MGVDGCARAVVIPGRDVFSFWGVVFNAFEWEVCFYRKMMEFQKPHHPFFWSLEKPHQKTTPRTQKL